MRYSKQDIVSLVEEEDVEFIRLQFVDIFGTVKNLAVTSSQLEKVLNNRCMFDGAAIDAFSSERRSDYYLAPDLDTFEIFPWRPQQGKVARLICDVLKADGSPFEGDSRYILKKVIKEAEEMGYTFDVGPECEFFLFNTDEAGEVTTQLSDKGSYFDIGPIDVGENARREMVLFLEDMDFEIASSYHSNEVSQHEIDFKYDNALKTADNIVTFKMVVRIVARRHGLHATFMPKPKTGMEGSGMHLNMSLSKNGKNIFGDADDEKGLSKEAYQFMAGVIKHIEGMTLIHNPIVNSYKRLISGFGAPISEGWSIEKKNSLIRVTTIGGDGARLELRSPDAASNPYLVLALCLAAGLEGIKKQINPPLSLEENKQSQSLLPHSLEEAIATFKKDKLIKDVLGEHISNAYIKIKTKEWKEYIEQVSSWEVEKYLHKI